MAKTLNSMSIADAFANHGNTVILDGIGGKNPEDASLGEATTYVAFVTDEVAPVLGKVRTKVNNNWHNLGENDAERLSKVPAYVLENLDSFIGESEKTFSPLHQAVQNILVSMFPTAPQFAGKSGVTLARSARPDVEKFIRTASLEKYEARINAEIASIAAATAKRGRKGKEGGVSANRAELSFDVDESLNDAAE